MNPFAILVAGPTASGKSSLAYALAKALDGIIVNADSKQIYRELRILTARPSAETQFRVPHRLYGIMSAVECCSVVRWKDLASAEIATAHREGKVPIITGGSGLYLRSLTKGLAFIPPIPCSARQAAVDTLEKLGTMAFHAELAKRDPEMAARLSCGDSHRLIRAWEVLDATGVSLAEWQRRQSTGRESELGALAFVTAPQRDTHNRTCDSRFLDMMEAGALEEVDSLLALGLSPKLPAMKALGVKPLSQHLQGLISLEQAIMQSQRDTRQYAKRQGTWFRHQMSDAVMLEDSFSQEVVEFVIKRVRRFLLTRK